MRQWMVLALGMLPFGAAAADMPPEVATFLDRVERCSRAAGLESHESERRDQVHQTYENLGCRNLVHDEAQLRDQFADNQAAIDALDAAKRGKQPSSSR